ncbi:hypothetical protein NKH77_47065 [Streptomyces sp. M19]
MSSTTKQTWCIPRRAPGGRSWPGRVGAAPGPGAPRLIPGRDAPRVQPHQAHARRLDELVAGG